MNSNDDDTPSGCQVYTSSFFSVCFCVHVRYFVPSFLYRLFHSIFSRQNAIFIHRFCPTKKHYHHLFILGASEIIFNITSFLLFSVYATPNINIMFLLFTPFKESQWYCVRRCLAFKLHFVFYHISKSFSRYHKIENMLFLAFPFSALLQTPTILIFTDRTILIYFFSIPILAEKRNEC